MAMRIKFRLYLGGWAKSDSQSERRSLQRRRLRHQGMIEDPTNPTLIPFDGVNIHERGLLVVAERCWTPGTMVSLQLSSFQLTGFAVVRHCEPRKDGTYALGLEFCGALQHYEEGTWQVRRASPRAESWTEDDEAHSTDYGVRRSSMGFEWRS